MKLGIVKELRADERRVAAAPSTVARWIKAGWEVVVESGAGAGASFPDGLYQAAGATIAASAGAVWAAADVLCKVRPPAERADGSHEADDARAGQVVVSFVYPAQHPELVQRLAARQATVLAMDCIPRISRAQKVDALSSMANIAGYRAVVEAATRFGSFFTGQITAAGKVPPAKVLIIGGGVAGLAALGAAKGLGAVVRAFDVRPSVADQVRSLGGEFLTVEIEESGEGQGGYAKEMSPAFIEAEMALFRKQAAEVNIVITTALIPGKPAPKLWLTDMVEAMKPGSVIVDMAAEAGGNCTLTQPGEVVEHAGVTVIGYTDLPSRMANVASELYGTNLWHLLDEMGGVAKWKVDRGNDIVRGALVTDGGEVTWPPPKIADPTKPSAAAAAASPTAATGAAKPATAPTPAASAPAPTPSSSSSKKGHGHGAAASKPVPGAVLVALLVAFAGAFIALRYGMSSTDASRDTQQLLQHLTVFVLAIFVGWQVVWNVTPALHTPLMSVTNAISGIIIVGGLLGGGGELNASVAVAIAAALFATINIVGGFWVTRRMLAMFRK